MRQTFAAPYISRRHFIGLAAGALASGMSASAFGATTSVMDSIKRQRALNNTDREGNTTAALEAINSIEPILSYDTIYNLQQALAQYEFIIQNGGFPAIDRGAYGLVAGNDRNDVRDLRAFLIATGDLHPDEGTRSRLFDGAVDGALRRFQARHGLVVTGKLDRYTFFSMQVPAEARIQQLSLNLTRVSSMAGELADRYVVVNIPAAAIEAVDMGSVTRRHTAIVGRIDRQTPILESKTHEINFNPFWTVPKSIIRNDLITYMNENPNYLAENRIRIFDGSGNELSPMQIDWTTDDAVQYTFRQDPGAENSMGHVKINFHNPHAVYLHDTPQKSLFGENRRFHSSGCVRVEDVSGLVSWLLRSNNGWDEYAVQSVFTSGERMDVALNDRVQILTTYITAWSNRQGIVSFRDDVYDFDTNGIILPS